jgi:predicted HD phosphohydrolase
LGTVFVYDAIAELATIIDPLDPYLGALTQLTHQLQLVEAMERDGMDDEMILCGLVHDLGKLLIKYSDEDPINVEAGGEKVPLAGEPGGGLMNCTFRWDHGDFAFLRLKEHASPEIAWLVRHHSIDLAGCRSYMDENDRRYVDRLIKFVHYDNQKDMYAVPTKTLEDYRPLIERAFPHPIVI